MKKYSSNYPQRNAFNEALYETVEEFLQEIDIRPSDTVLAVNSKTMETGLGTKSEFAAGWETYPIDSLIRNNEDNTEKRVDTDATFEIASSFYFVK